MEGGGEGEAASQTLLSICCQICAHILSSRRQQLQQLARPHQQGAAAHEEAAEGAGLVWRQGGTLGVCEQEGRGGSVGVVGVQQQGVGCSDRGGWGEGVQQGMGEACGAHLSIILALVQTRKSEGYSMGHAASYRSAQVGR